MTDRELLELAAKAAGIEGTYREHEWFPGIVEPVIGGGDQPWKPLISDQQALRLAVKLGMGVSIGNPQNKEPRTLVVCYCNKNTSETFTTIENHGDPYAATRMAIVRAAAEIGSGMRPFPSVEEIKQWVGQDD